MRARQEDPYPLERSMEADTNVLLRDPRINGGHIRAFIRSKYGSRGSTLAELLEVQYLGWLLDAFEDSGSRPASRYLTFSLDKVTENGEPLVYRHYHTDPRGKAEIQYTDALTRPLHALARGTTHPSQHGPEPGPVHLSTTTRAANQVESRQA